MPIVKNMHDAKSELSELVSRAEAGEDVLIARRGKPVVRLVPVEGAEKKRRVGGSLSYLRGTMPPDLFLQPLSEKELAEWEGEHSFEG